VSYKYNKQAFHLNKDIVVLEYEKIIKRLCDTLCRCARLFLPVINLSFCNNAGKNKDCFLQRTLASALFNSIIRKRCDAGSQFMEGLSARKAEIIAIWGSKLIDKGGKCFYTFPAEVHHRVKPGIPQHFGGL